MTQKVTKELYSLSETIDRIYNKYNITFHLKSKYEHKEKNRRFLRNILSIMGAILLVFLTPFAEYILEFLRNFFGF